MPNFQSLNLIESRQLRSSVPSPKYRIDTGLGLRTTYAPATRHSEDSNRVCGVWRVVYIALAGLFFALGMIGILLPGLPTTPFLLLTSYFLARSWPRVHRMLLANKLFGPILRHWQQHRAVEPRVKIQATFLVGLAMMLLMFFSNLPPIQLGAVLTLASIGLLTIYWLPTSRRLESEKQ